MSWLYIAADAASKCESGAESIGAAIIALGGFALIGWIFYLAAR